MRRILGVVICSSSTPGPSCGPSKKDLPKKRLGNQLTCLVGVGKEDWIKKKLKRVVFGFFWFGFVLNRNGEVHLSGTRTSSISGLVNKMGRGHPNGNSSRPLGGRDEN